MSTTDVDRLSVALHKAGVGCPFDLHWRPERHEADWHDLQARAILDDLVSDSGHPQVPNSSGGYPKEAVA